MLFYSSYGDEEGLKYLLDISEKEGKYNVAFETAYLLAQPDSCVRILMKSKRYSEAGMFAKAYIPTMIPEIMKEWGDVLKQNSLLFVPENICESPDFKEQMKQSTNIFNSKINP